MKGLLKRNVAAAEGGNVGGTGAAAASSSAAYTPVNELDLGMIVRLQLGQQSRRFFKARYVMILMHATLLFHCIQLVYMLTSF